MAKKLLFNIEVDGNFTKLNKLEKSISDLKKQRQELIKLSKTEEGLNNRQQAQLTKLNQQIKLQTNERRKAEKAVQQNARAQNNLADKYELESQKLAKLQRQLKNMILTEGEGSKKTQELAAKVGALDAKLKSVDAAAGQFGRSVGNYENATKGVIRSFEKERQVLVELKKQLRDVALNTGAGSKETIKLSSKVRNLETELNKIDNSVKGVNSTMQGYKTALMGSIGTMGQFATGVGAVYAGVQIARQAIGDAVSRIKNFEQANANLSAVLGDKGTTGALKLLKDEAKRLGAATSFSATQVAELQTEFAKLGFDPQEIVNLTESTLDASAALGSDLAAQAALTGSTLKAFGLDASEAGRVNDVLAKAASSSALDFEKLNSSMSTIAPVAKAFGFSLEESTSLLGELSNAGFDASSAATATRNIILNLADGNGKLAKSLGGPVKSLPELVDGLNKLKGEGIDLASALELTDKRSVAAFSTFLEGTDSITKLNLELQNAGGTAKEMADKQLNTLEGRLKILDSAWEGLILSFEDGDGVLNKIAKFIVDDLATALSILSGNTEDVEGKMGLLSSIVNDLKIKFELLKVPFTIVNKIAEKLADSIAKVAEKFGLVSKDANKLNKEIDNSQKIMLKMPEIIGIVGEEVGESLSRIIDQFMGFAKAAKGAITGDLSAVKEGGKEFKEAFEKGFDDLYKDIPDRIRKLFEKEIDYASFRSPKPKLDRFGRAIADDIKEGVESQLSKGLIESQEKLVSKLQDELSKATSEKQIIKIKTRLFFEEKELDRLKELGERLDVEIGLVPARNASDNLKEEIRKSLDEIEPADFDFEEKSVLATFFEINKDEIVQTAFNTAQEAADAVFKVQQDNAERRKKFELDQLDIQTQRERDLLESRRESGEISQAEFEDNRIALAQQTEQKRIEIEKKAFENKKRLDTAQALINGAVAITKTLATLGIPAGIIPAAGAAASTAIQIAAIQAQKFATGGQVKDYSGQLIDGNSNIPTQSNGDSVLATLKPGEVVLNDRQQAALGGADTFRKIGVPGFANGGLVPSYTPGFATGGVVSVKGGVTSSDLDRQTQAIIAGFNDKRVINVASDTVDTFNQTQKIENEFTL